MNNFRAVRFAGCDVYLACASQLPVDPNGVGSEAGQVDPSDMMNPILYKAVSNDYFDTIISRIYGGVAMNPSSDGSSITSVEGLTNASQQAVGFDDFAIYYGVLSHSEGWKKAMPQVGFEMKGLKPLMWEMLNNYGNTMIPAGYNSTRVPILDGGSVGGSPSGGIEPPTVAREKAFEMRGSARLAPPMPLWAGLNADNSTLATTFPYTYVGAIIVPPCHTAGSRLYYRMRIVWHLEFIGLTSHQAIGTFLEMANNGRVFYYKDYTAESKMEGKTDMVDVSGMEIEKIMEG